MPEVESHRNQAGQPAQLLEHKPPVTTRLLLFPQRTSESGLRLPETTFLKRLLILILILASLVATISVGGYLYLSSRDHHLVKEQIQETLQTALGRSVTIEGPLQFELGLLPRVSLSDITVANAEWGTGSHLLTIRQLSIQPHLLPLLRGEIVLNRLDIQGVDLWLENDRSGRQNWALQAKDEKSEGDARFRVRTVTGSEVKLATSMSYAKLPPREMLRFSCSVERKMPTSRKRSTSTPSCPVK